MNPVIEEAVKKLSPLCGNNCKIGLILGSGLGGYAERLEICVR
jgi:purine nucleoside phosphorylase